MRIILLGMCMAIANSGAITKNELQKVLSNPHPFAYDFGIKLIPSKSEQAGVTICCHGYGHSNQIAQVVHSFGAITDHIIGFNFPDYNCVQKSYDPNASTFGSIDEILPLLYLMKLCVIEAKLGVLNLYGFSAGGGAVINALATLNQTKYDEQLCKIGITDVDKKKIIAAVQKGYIILDCPLKSIDEIMAVRGKSAEFDILAQRYIKNALRPIDVVDQLKGLALSIILHFQTPDEIIGNRDDQLFIDRLKKANSGTTTVILGSDGGHNSYHKSLWREFALQYEKKRVF